MANYPVIFPPRKGASRAWCYHADLAKGAGPHLQSPARYRFGRVNTQAMTCPYKKCTAKSLARPKFGLDRSGTGTSGVLCVHNTLVGGGQALPPNPLPRQKPGGANPNPSPLGTPCPTPPRLYRTIQRTTSPKPRPRARRQPSFICPTGRSSRQRVTLQRAVIPAG